MTSASVSSRLRRLVIAVAGGLLLASSARGQTVTEIRHGGDPANRVDLVIVGDGYTAAEIGSGKYAMDIETFTQQLFLDDPYKEYQGYYNVRRVDIASAESGADHPHLNVFRNTAFDASYDCAGIQRLICVNTGKVNTALAATGLPINARDTVLVVVNDAEYGGSGGSIAVASTNALAVEIILHELGHSFALLADEYGGPPPPTCNAVNEPSQVNATKETTRALIKWRLWIDPATPVPTPGTQPSVPGLYPGAMYCDTTLFRPTYDSKMRSLNRPFDQINTEQHIRRIYNLVSPLDSWAPAVGFLAATQESPAAFSVAVPQPRTHALSVVWRVDNVDAGTGTSFNATGIPVGTHQVTATASDPTGLVRGDPALLLSEGHSWTLTVLPQTSLVPVLSMLAPSSVETGAEATTLLVSGSGFAGGGLVPNNVARGVGPASFAPGAMVQVDGSDRPTVFLSPSLLQVTISAADRQAQGTHAITVVSPAPGGTTSNALALTVVSPVQKEPTRAGPTQQRLTAGRPGRKP